LLDRLFRKIGLSGKALIPFIIGTGCSVPGIMSSRIMEDIYDRKVTAVITPFIPCSAKLPIIALFTGYFFRDNYALIATSFYFISIILIIISSLIIKKVFNKNYTSSYISELPEFKLPSFRYLFKDVLDKMKEFVIKAGTIIFLSSVLIWFLLSFSTNFEYGVNIQNSILAFLGRKISWFFYPIVGRNSWEISVSAIQGLIAKEQVVSSMEIISGLSGEFRNTFEIFADGSPFSFLNNSSSYAFVIFNLFSAPCIAAIATMKKELGNFKYTFLAIIFQIFLAWIVSVLFLYIIKIFI
ncbi:MAG: nucleoside recognition domain-containing protein, partial [bacterium]|nr:nucleoside recognition domain-containing protein [bacterium]